MRPTKAERLIMRSTKRANARTKRTKAPVDALVGQNIRICRLQRGLSQTELGDRVGVTFQQIQKYEKGVNRVGASRLIQIASALGVPLATLFDGNPDGGRGEPDLAERALLTKPHALRLAQGFDRIADAASRAVILELVETLGAASVRAQRRIND
jgi:transcriptional regulator with XRE-family HTH domain